MILMISFVDMGCHSQTSYHGDPARLDDGFWSFYSSESQTVMSDVWRIEDGVLICKGSPLGYIYSTEDFTNFVLKLEWRWPAEKEPGKAGVLLRMTGENKIWPTSLEAQLNADAAGDFWGLDGYELSGPADRMNSLTHDKFGKLIHVKKTQDREKAAGQWNTYEIRARGDTVTLLINGVQVNQATDCDVDPGRICLTSEGSEIHFRNITLTPLSRK